MHDSFYATFPSIRKFRPVKCQILCNYSLRNKNSLNIKSCAKKNLTVYQIKNCLLSNVLQLNRTQKSRIFALILIKYFLGYSF